MKYYFLILCIIFSACVTKNACERKFPPQVSDSIIIVKHDTTITISHDTTLVEGKIIRVRDTINHTQTIYKTEFKIVHDSILKIRYINTTDNRTKVNTVTVMKTAWYFTFCIWWFIITLILLLLFILWGYITKKIPF